MDFSDDDVDELQQIADYWKAQKKIRTEGAGSLAFGGLAVLMGVLALFLHPVNIFLVLIGLVLIAVGAYNLYRPTALGIVVDGVSLLIIAAWNITVGLLNMQEGVEDARNLDGKAVVLGFFQIGWAIYFFFSYPRLRRELAEPPSRRELKRMDSLMESLSKTKAAGADDIIEFTANTFVRPHMWKGRLSGNAAFFLEQDGADVMVAFKDDVRFKSEGKVLLGKKLKATFKIRHREWRGFITPANYRRYKQWKKRADEPSEEA